MLDELKQLIDELDPQLFFAPNSVEQLFANLVILLLLAAMLLVAYKVITRLVRG